jgi:isoquinoline 1-oxidoreductase beta subunit
MTVSRRTFLIATAAAGACLTVAVYLKRGPGPPPLDDELIAVERPPDAFVRMSTDGKITVMSKHTEMGQGIYSCLATIVAEELDAAWSDMRVDGAPADAKLYANSWYGSQLTGGSTSLMNSWDQLRQAGAVIRQMLISAAAEEWNVPKGEIITADSRLRHAPTGREGRYGEFTERAAGQPVPAYVRLKTPDEYRLIGSNLPRLDIPEKTTGSIQYTQDVKLPGMLTAMVVHSPRFGGKLASFDASAAESIDGVFRITAVPSGVAVIARDFWTANKARELLEIEWDESGALLLGSGEMMDELRAMVSKPGLRARDDGNIDKALELAASVIEAEYEFPYLAHAPLEPMNCVVQIKDGGCEIWHGAQWQTQDQADAADILGIPLESVTVNMLLAGGAFGRRATIDYQREAIEVAKAALTDRPVKLVWTREDDMQGGMYRPMFFHRIRGAVDANGRLIAWHQQVAGQSIAANIDTSWLEDGIDNMSVHGSRDSLYEISNFRIESYNKEYPIPVLWYRGTGRSHTAFAMEAFMDELAESSGVDPVEFRRPLLSNSPRLLNVMETAARLADWGMPMLPGRARGIAVFYQNGTSIAQVAEVTLHSESAYSVDRVI